MNIVDRLPYLAGDSSGSGDVLFGGHFLGLSRGSVALRTAAAVVSASFRRYFSASSRSSTVIASSPT
jgi:hypothetical protein